LRLCFEILGAVFNGSASQPYRMPQSVPRDMYGIKESKRILFQLAGEAVRISCGTEKPSPHGY